MSLNAAETFVVICYKTVWSLAHASVAYAIWALFVADALGLPQLGYLEAVAIYALTRLIISPPSLSIEIG